MSVSLIGLRHKTQWKEANHRVGWFWVLNTFPRPYLNFEPISLVVRSMVLPWEDAIYMVPRPLQKLSGDSHFRCVHKGFFSLGVNHRCWVNRMDSTRSRAQLFDASKKGKPANWNWTFSPWLILKTILWRIS